MNYYNEIDPFAADWLCQLINAGHIAPGVVDTRSIEDITPYELREFTQCHFFAGIGVWSYVLRQAGWPDDRPVWTGSCPCQPFSAAGKGKGFTDERHLWPALFHLIEQCRPVAVFGEQVASKDGLTWLDLVQADLEGAGYAVGAVDSCAAGFGAPHLRQRLYWAADSGGERLPAFQRKIISREIGNKEGRTIEQCGCSSRRMADTKTIRRDEQRQDSFGRGERSEKENVEQRPWCSGVCTLGDSEHTLSPRGEFEQLTKESRTGETTGLNASSENVRRAPGPGPVNGFWGIADWLFCRDEKWRAVEPGAFPLVDGAANRVGRLRGYGNAIVAPQAKAFIEAFMETQND